MRDPTSSFSFTNYLHSKNRLAAYINREANIPSRREWSAYLAWAAKRMSHAVHYGEEVVTVEPVSGAELATTSSHKVVEEVENSDRGSIRMLRVTSRKIATGELTIRLARNITVAVGGVPRVPNQLLNIYQQYHHYLLPSQRKEYSRIVHSGSYLPSLAQLEPKLREVEVSRSSTRQQPLRFVVVGGGQSSCEMALHLRKTFPTAHVALVFRASALVPSDDSAFVNAVAFDPERTDVFWKRNESQRLAWLAEYRRTNYSVVRSDVLNELHTAVYDQTIEHEQPWPNAEGPQTGSLTVLPNTQIDEASLLDDNDGHETIQLRFSSTKGQRDNVIREWKARTQKVDALFLGTGFERRPTAMKFLEELQSYFPLLDEDATEKKRALGFAGEREGSTWTRPARGAGENGDEEEEDDDEEGLNDEEKLQLEYKRHRTRGITRDYRLVSYLSDAFKQAPPPSSPTGQCSSSSPSLSASIASATRRVSQLTTQSSVSSSRNSSRDSSKVGSPANTRRGSAAVSETASSRSSVTLHDEDGNATLRTAAAVAGASSGEKGSDSPAFEANMYFLGGNEATHGLSDSLLSIVAHRAGELTKSLLAQHELQTRNSRRTSEVAPSSTTLKINASSAQEANLLAKTLAQKLAVDPTLVAEQPNQTL